MQKLTFETHLSTTLLFLSYNTFASASPQDVAGLISPQNTTENLNQYIKPFENCLVHLINYEGRDFIAFQFPIVFSRYISVKVQQRPDGSKYFHPRGYIYSTPVENLRNSSEWINYVSEKEYRSSKYNWKCFAQIYYNPPDMQGEFRIPDEFHQFWKRKYWTWS